MKDDYRMLHHAYHALFYVTSQKSEEGFCFLLIYQVKTRIIEFLSNSASVDLCWKEDSGDS